MTPDYAPMFYWVKEREALRLRKDVLELPAPWTDDPIIGKYRFCNVRREDDRVTVWINENIRKPFAGHPYLWLMLCIARQINWPESLAELIDGGTGWPGDDFDPSMMAHVLNERKSLGGKIYTGAYMISAPATKGADKQTYIAETVIGALWYARETFDQYLTPTETTAPLIEGMHALLSSFNGWGPFMAYQAVVDMRFTPLLENAADRESWCAAGPGTIRGLNRLHGRDVKYALPQPQARAEIRKIWECIRQETGVNMDFSDVPNCLCETDKYLRVKNGEGLPRAIYRSQA